jgi:uncharacterized protein (TIGR02594 family)
MAFNYLKSNVPKIIKEAYKLMGVSEIVGSKHNPEILAWADKLSLKNVYTSDEIPWCGLFVAYVCLMAKKEVVKDPLWARNWNKFGTKEVCAKLGDILVFSRGSGGHVGFYVGEDPKAYFVLGGNQGNTVSIVKISKSRCIGIRRPEWKIAEPRSVRQIFLDVKGNLSTNEA